MNYQKLQKVLRCHKGDETEFALLLSHHQSTRLSITVKERCPYTTMIDLSLLQGVKWLDCHFELRLYDDVKSLDVVAFQGHKHIWPVQTYPNTQMYQPDEKHQHQQFLSHLLLYCLENGLHPLS